MKLEKFTHVTVMQHTNSELYADFQGVLALFDNTSPTFSKLEVGQRLPVVVTRLVRSMRDRNVVNFALLHAVDPENDALVSYRGFECEQGSCSELSTGWTESGARVTLSPGRTGVYCVDNLQIDFHNKGRSYGGADFIELPRRPLRAGHGIVSQQALHGAMRFHKVVRLNGVLNLSDLSWFNYCGKTYGRGADELSVADQLKVLKEIK